MPIEFAWLHCEDEIIRSLSDAIAYWAASLTPDLEGASLCTLTLNNPSQSSVNCLNGQLHFSLSSGHVASFQYGISTVFISLDRRSFRIFFGLGTDGRSTKYRFYLNLFAPSIPRLHPQFFPRCNTGSCIIIDTAASCLPPPASPSLAAHGHQLMTTSSSSLPSSLSSHLPIALALNHPPLAALGTAAPSNWTFLECCHLVDPSTTL